MGSMIIPFIFLAALVFLILSPWLFDLSKILSVSNNTLIVNGSLNVTGTLIGVFKGCTGYNIMGYHDNASMFINTSAINGTGRMTICSLS